MSSTYITMVVHGESKVGKTWLGSTAPAPILVLDAEAGGMRFVPGRKISWNPLKEDPPEPGDWDICTVTVTDTMVIETTRDWIQSGRHPFVSIVIDSLTEIQSRMKREISAVGDLEQQDWGRLLIKIEDYVMQFRDMTEAQDQLRAFVCIAGTRMRDEKFRPYMQGQIATILPYKVDVNGYLKQVRDEAGDLRRGLQIVQDRNIDAGNRVGGHLPDVVWDPNISNMLEQIEQGVNNT